MKHKPNNAAEKAELSSRDFRIYDWTQLSPSSLGSALRDFRRGEFRFAGMLFSNVEEYDMQVGAVAQKRYRAVAKCGYEIALVGEASPEAQAQKELLEDLFNTLSASDVLHRDMSGGPETLIYQLMSSVGYKYAAAEKIWRPASTDSGAQTYHLETIFCPLHFFEAKDRRLRIRTKWTQDDGEALDPSAWIIAVYPARALMPATAIGYMLKQTPLEDWASTVEKFGTPMVAGKTKAVPGSPEWCALEDALTSFGTDCGIVLGSDVELVVQQIAQGTFPHAALIEYVDRALSTVWRGGDLSTQSRAEAVGANGQAEELNAIEEFDRMLIMSVIDAQIVKPFVRLVFGEKTPRLAYFNFKTNDAARIAARINILDRAHAWGMDLSVVQIREELGLAVPSPGEEVLSGASAQTAQQFAPGMFANAKKSSATILQAVAEAQSDADAKKIAAELTELLPTEFSGTASADVLEENLKKEIHKIK